MWRQLFEIRPSDRGWHLPVLAGLSVGIPLLAGYFLDNLPAGKLAALAGLVILYLHRGSFARRMLTLMACSFGITASFATGLLFGFHPLAACLALAVLAFLIHLALYALRLFHPPGNFFFIMIASMALCMPFSPTEIVSRIGLVSIGTMVSCSLGLIYCVLTDGRRTVVLPKVKAMDSRIHEAALFGIFAGISLLVALLFRFPNPYWVPTSCLAVMQGVNSRSVWQRGVQRIVGTMLGLMLTWGILLLQPSSLTICLAIVVIQIMVELLIVRNYGLAVIFLTVLTVFLAEPTTALAANPGNLIRSRLVDILTGSVLGMAGGWLLFNERLRQRTRRNRSEPV